MNYDANMRLWRWRWTQTEGQGVARNPLLSPSSQPPVLKATFTARGLTPFMRKETCTLLRAAEGLRASLRRHLAFSSIALILRSLPPCCSGQQTPYLMRQWGEEDCDSSPGIVLPCHRGRCHYSKSCADQIKSATERCRKKGFFRGRRSNLCHSAEDLLPLIFNLLAPNDALEAPCSGGSSKLPRLL